MAEGMAQAVEMHIDEVGITCEILQCWHRIGKFSSTYRIGCKAEDGDYRFDASAGLWFTEHPA